MKFFILGFFVTLSCAVYATEEAAPVADPIPSYDTFDAAFNDGVQKYQTKAYDKARLAFSKAVEFDANNVQALTNLALVQFQLGQKGWALALLRKANTLVPSFSTPISAIRFIEKNLETKEVPHEIETFENLRTAIIAPISLTSFLGFLAICFFSAGWLWIDFFAHLKNQNRSKRSIFRMPALKIVVSLIFVFAAVLSVLKIVDQSTSRATIVVDKATVFSAPNAQSVALLDLYAGLQVNIEQFQDEWVQVTYPGTPTGWIPKASLFQTSGEH